jgi:energy-coupling factor transporter ATP-binding protein EcfA2
MRLLSLDSTGKLALTDFSGKTVPPYAILSHRWTEDEVLFQDVRNNTYEKKAGFQKIQFCAKQARENNLDYFWVDTCCIDKWNLSELSKSINSMYRWYEEAQKCFVLLHDVSCKGQRSWIEFLQQSPWVLLGLSSREPVTASSDAEIDRQQVWAQSFQRSAWFTRGWTLQELIAPKIVEFFSREGRLLGDKNSLEDMICMTTSIPAEALQDRELEHFSIAERIKWAENRTTTEPEDRAYCLLGILSAQMSVNYGEGEEQARKRLQNELNSASATPSNIPIARNTMFTSRESELASLEDKPFQGRDNSVIAITGTAGIGKSQLALELSYLVKEKYPDCQVFWLDASDTFRLQQSFLVVAQKLQIPGWNLEGADVMALVKIHLSSEEVRNWLIVLDGLDDVQHQSADRLSDTSQLADALPRSSKGSVVITTTDRHVFERIPSVETFELDTSSPTAAATILCASLPSSILKAGDSEMMLLLKELQYNALAIEMAALYIKLANMSFGDYRARLIRSREDRLDEDDGHLHEASADDGLHSAIGTTLMVTLDEVCRSNHLAAEYLRTMACINEKDIPLEFLQANSTQKKEKAIAVLSDYGLITRRATASAVEIRRVVHGTLFHWLKRQDLLDKTVEIAVDRMLKIFPDEKYGNRSKWRRLIPHAKRLLAVMTNDMDHLASIDLAERLSKALNSEGRQKEVEQLQERVVAARQTALGEKHWKTLTGMSDLAMTYWYQGQKAEAEQLQSTVVERSKLALGLEDIWTLYRMTRLAFMYGEQGRLTEAEQLEAVVLETSKSILGVGHLNTLWSMTSLTRIYRKQQRWSEAEQLQLEAIETRKVSLGAEDPSSLWVIDELASVYQDQERWGETEQLQLMATEIRKRMLGEEHANTLGSMFSLARTYSHQQRWTESEQLEVAVIETRKSVLGEEHPDTLRSIWSLAMTHDRQERYDEAEPLHLIVLEARRRTLGDEHPDTL